MARFVQFPCLYMGYVWFVLSKFVVDVVSLPRLVLLLGGVFLSQILGYAAIYYITPHKTHVKGDFSAFRCTGRVNVQGQAIGTKKGTQSPFRFCTGRVLDPPDHVDYKAENNIAHGYTRHHCSEC